MASPHVSTEAPTRALGVEGIVVSRSAVRDGRVPVVVGVIDAGTLAQTYVIPRRDTRRKTGYQRDPSPARVNRLAKDLSSGRVDLPTAILLNMRDCGAEEVIDVRGGVTYFIPGGHDLHVVDGQHRVLALEKLVLADPERWSSFMLPFVCMLGADEREEMRQFYVVNSTAKSVRTDLALDLLKQRAESDPAVLSALIERGEDWKVRAQALVEGLVNTSVWRQRVQLPRDAKGQATLTSSSLAGSLKSLLATPYFGALQADAQLRILDVFWQGVRLVLPEAFDEPTKYALQKSVGAFVMHNVLISVLEYLRSKGGSVIDRESYVEALHEPLLELEGDTALGEPVKGADFWLTGAGGAAGSFSSSAGQRLLISRLKGMLPEIPIE